jgi:NAD(P)-dependent dehydrogenase (short-subunit alcohol dehydrogenase family)
MHKTLFSTILSAMLLAAVVLSPGTARAEEPALEQAPPKAVLVTGASSGIGRKITEVLAARGYFVYAGARKDADLAELNRMDNVEAVRLDVTSQADIEAAVALIAEAGRGLHGVVNNAGVAIFAPMNETPEADIDFVFDVNVYGPYRINKAFMPLLVANQGRTTTIGSISGFISGARSGTYSMSKFAVEAYTDALAAEMAESGVRVSVIEPGGFRSEIREKVVMHMMGKAPGETGNLTEEEQQQLARMRERNAQLKEPDEVAEAVVHALFAEKPKLRYMVAPDREEATLTIRTALERVAQLNADQPYSYSVEELAAMLKEAMAGQ